MVTTRLRWLECCLHTVYAAYSALTLLLSAHFGYMLGTARVRRFPLPEIVLWTTASQHPSESQTSECSDLLSRSRATFVIAAQRQPGKFTPAARVCLRVNMSNTAPPLRKLPLGGSLKKLSKSHQCAPSTATFSKRRNVGARNAGGAATVLPSRLRPRRNAAVCFLRHCATSPPSLSLTSVFW